MRLTLRLVGVSVALAGCHATTVASSPAPVPPAARVDADDVRIELGSSGMAAFITAPHEARVHATPDGVELRGGADFHLHVRRGSLDPLQEKAVIVRAYDEDFRRFLRDRGTEVVYETSSLTGPRFHFFFTDDHYHCRTPADGVGSLEAVEHMLDACRAVRLRRELDSPRAIPGGRDPDREDSP